jgi:CheY-like chemotaxis protein
MKNRAAKIIVADDSKTSAMLLSVLLDRMGFEVIPAENGEVALKLARITRPDLILVDLVMPILDGFSVLEKIKADQQISDIPAVVVTIKGDKPTEERCRELGCAGFVRKPVKLRQLHEYLERYAVRKSRKRRKWIRAPYNRRVSVTFEGQTLVHFAPILSEGGIYVRIKEPLPLGSEVCLSVVLDEEIRLQGRVIYHRDVFADMFQMDPGMAIEFTSVSTDAAAALSTYLTTQLAGDLVEEQDEEVISLVEKTEMAMI